MIIYSLASSEDPEIIRYIGYTTQTKSRRFSGHKEKKAGRLNKKEAWVSSVLAKGFELVMEEIMECKSLIELKKAEVRTIALYKACGAKLVNGTNGGDSDFDPEVRRKGVEERALLCSKEVFYFDANSRSLLGSFPSGASADRHLKLTKGTCANAASENKGRIKNGLVFSYAKEFPEFVPYLPKNNYPHPSKGKKKDPNIKYYGRNIYLNKENEKYLEFSSIKECADYFSCSKNTVNIGIKKGYFKGFNISADPLADFYIKNSKNSKGKILAKTTRAQKVKATSKDISVEFDSLTKCSEYFNTTTGNICHYITNNYKTLLKGYKIEKI